MLTVDISIVYNILLILFSLVLVWFNVKAIPWKRHVLMPWHMSGLYELPWCDE